MDGFSDWRTYGVHVCLCVVYVVSGTRRSVDNGSFEQTKFLGLET